MRNRKWNAKRSLAVAVACTMAVSCCPASAFASVAAAPAAGYQEAASGSGYVLMNIPYDDFYRAELKNNEVKVDAFTSATLNKTRTKSLVAGSYHVDPNGTDITGVTFPVRVNDLSALQGKKQVTDGDSVEITVTNRGNTSTETYKGRDALFESDSYSYYLLDETPAAYKELTVASDGSFRFGAVTGAKETTLTPEKVTITTDSSYGDYQVEITGLDAIGSDEDIYGVILTTADGSDYALRHMENIWRVWNLAWSVGFVKEVHGGPISSAHYASMMGKTIKTITYYTKDAVYRIPVDLAVPVKTEMSAEVTEPTAAGASVELKGAPSDFTAAYEVDGKEASCAAGRLTFAEELSVGSHTLTVKDTGGKYAPVKTEFVVSTTDKPAAYNGKASAPAIVAAEGFDSAALAAYIANIASVSVNGKEYAAAGRGAVAIVGENGAIDVSVKSGEEDVFNRTGANQVSVKSTGYPELSFSLDLTPAETKKLAAPKSVKAVSAAYNKIKVTWKKVSGAESYIVYRSAKKASGYKKVGTSKTASYTDSGLTLNKTYYYKVKAAGTSAGTSSASAAAGAKTVLPKPSSLKAAAGKKQVTLTWKKVTGAVKYNVYRASKKNGTYKKVASVKTNKCVNGKLTKGVTYYYKVSAVRGKVESAKSAVKSAKAK